ncbi:MAG: cell division ATP-binding protein FtsE [Gammaproteobacteria bacterium]|nr:cell division ATP-binding protein FtsE [Gammaproteobacteria bacterium]
MIRMQNVAKRYAQTGEVLSQLNLELAPAEFAFLTGASGAGKSTLLKLIALIEAPSRGNIFLNGRNVTHAKRSQIAKIRSRMGLIFQDHRLLQDRNVFENVALPLRISGYSQREIPRRVRAALDKVGLLRKEKAEPIALSGGEQQRVGIARAIVHKPRLLLADEPTGNLDPTLSLEIFQLLAQFQQVGVTVLVASHDLNLIAQMDKRVIKLEHGQVLTPLEAH